MTQRRRRLLIALAVMPFAAPEVFGAQHESPRRIGVLTQAGGAPSNPWWAAFDSEMQRRGHVRGKDYVIDYRSTGGDTQRLAVLARELVTTKPTLVVATSTPAAVALKAATSDIPILLVTVGDPVGTGLVASLARPGGNVTGVSSVSTALVEKRLELLRELVPALERFAYLYDPDALNEQRDYKRLGALADKFGLRLVGAPARVKADLAAVFERLTLEKVGGVLVAAGLNQGRRAAITAHAAKHRLPAVYSNADFVVDGGLTSYAADYREQYGKLAEYIDKIFRGAHPRDLPVEQPTKVELSVNLKAARAAGITIPPVILMRAERVIE